MANNRHDWATRSGKSPTRLNQKSAEMNPVTQREISAIPIIGSQPAPYPADVFIVGSGFSKAVHEPMPTLDDLGRALADVLVAQEDEYLFRLGDVIFDILKAGRVPLGNVEMWLSSLAEPQPFMSYTDTLANRALFSELSQRVRQIIADAQEGFWQTAPAWLHWLARLWHVRRADVITFNYDTIIERSLIQLDPPHANGDLVSSVLGFLPRATVPLWGGAESIPSLRLYKLHGSLDWYWNPADNIGDSLCRRSPDATEADEKPALAGKEPFIVPPLSTKSPFYSLGVMRELWSDAAHAVQTADRIVMIGYSLPLTDLTSTAMLSFVGNPDVKWVVVNSDPNRVADHLVEIGVAADVISAYDSVPAWVDVYEADHRQKEFARLLQSVQRIAADEQSVAPIMLRRSRTDASVATAISVTGDCIYLVAHPLAGDVIPENYPRARDLARVMEQSEALRLMTARLSGIDGEFAVIGALDPQTVRGYNGILTWCALEIQDAPRQPRNTRV